jgi:prophage maintenance system killer protein
VETVQIKGKREVKRGIEYYNLNAILFGKGEAADVFGREITQNSIAGIVGNIFQSFGGQDLYPSIEEKAANLLYFIVKDHPFVDGNKRSGAFAFVWFLSKAGILPTTLTPEALTTITLLVAESNPAKKQKMIGIILLLLNNEESRLALF